MNRLPLHVVGPRWMADDLGGVHDYGFDAPDSPADFWCSGAHYASLRASGVDITFSTPGGMIPLVDSPWRTGVAVRSLADVLDDPPPGPVFSKLNDLKLTSFIARVRSMSELVRDLEELSESTLIRAPQSLPIALAEPLDLSRSMEVRCFVLDDLLVSACPYSDGRGDMGRGLDGLIDDEHLFDLAGIVDEFVASVPELPRAFVIDFAFISGKWVPLETNPASSSSWYCDRPPADVAKAIRAGQHDGDHCAWTDPVDHLVRLPLISERLPVRP